MITSIQQLNRDEIYAYADYLKWRLEERIELIGGYIFRLSPAPGLNHQRVSGKLFLAFGQHLEGKNWDL